MEFVNDLGRVALGSRLRALSERLYAIADSVYAARGLSLQGRWFPLLRLLHARGPSSVGEIADAIGQTHSAVSQLADKLVREGWLRAEADAKDRRRRRIALSAEAKRQMLAARPVWQAIDEVLEERCREEGIDLLDALGRFERLVDRGIVDAIAGRAAAGESAAVRIVPFEPALRGHFYRLNEEWLRTHFYLEEIDHRVLSDPEREILEPGGAIWFAMLGETVVGTCALKKESPGIYELSKMAVEPGHQGLGIGRQLIEATIAEFRRRRGRTLFLETNSKLGPALHLYEASGFEYQKARRADSPYARSNVYMIWRDPKSRQQAKRSANAGRKRSTGRALA